MEIASDPTGLRAAPHFRCQLQVVYPLVTASNWRSHDLLPAWFPLFARVAHRIQENTYIHMCTKLPQVAQMVKNLSAMREIWVRTLGSKIPWGRAWQPTPVFLPGESPWTEEPGGL